MGKYRIFKNKRTKYHPSIFISITVGEKWKNIEITSSPTKTGKYEKLSKNPNPNTPDKDAWFRKYIRNDPLWAIGEEFTKYSLSDEDEVKIDAFVKQHKKNKTMLNNKKKKLKKRGKKKTR